MGAVSFKVPNLIAKAKSAARAGDVSRARALYGQVLDRFPANSRARKGLAELDLKDPRVDDLLALWSAGHVDKALALSEELSVTHPTVRDIRAAAFRQKGKTEHALAIYEHALKTDSRNARLWFNTGGAQLEAHRLSDAERSFSKAVTLDPSPVHVLALAQCKLDQGDSLAARDLCDLLDSSDLLRIADKIRKLLITGKAQMSLNQMDLAISCFENAHDLKPDDPVLQHSLGIAAQAMGDTNKAADYFRNALSHDPNRMEIHRSLASLTRYAGDDAHLAQMKALLSRPLAPLAESDLRFALFKAFDDIRDDQAAFDHLLAANALRRAQFAYDPARDRALFDRLALLDCPQLAPTSPDHPRPIFIVGLPRSGTTLTEQILSGCPNTCAAGELPFVAQAALGLLRDTPSAKVSTTSLARFAQHITQGLSHYGASGHAVIDKMPLNFRWVAPLLAALPDARIVWMERPPLANAYSLFTHCFAGTGNRFAYDADDIAAMISLERQHRDKLCSQFADRIHVVNLDQLTHAPEPVIRELVAFCDLPWSDDCLTPHLRKRAVLTASAQQVREPLAPRTATQNPQCTALLADALAQHGIST